MNRIKNLPRWIIIAVLCALLFPPTLPARAQQQPQTITGIGTIGGDSKMPLTITFAPAGGQVSGSEIYHGPMVEVNGKGVCNGSQTITMKGTFAGGDGAAASGTLIYEMIIEGEPCNPLTTTFTGTWSGNFHANGSGNGTIIMDSGESLSWQVTYSPDEFQAALPVQITSKYIFTKYGIRVEDSFGGDEYDQTAWSDHELSLLNDVLKELPPGFLNHIALTRIVRNKVSIDADGNPKPGTCGAYFRCEEKTDPKCTGSLTTIRIFDSAATALPDFPNDPDKQFKSTILHEITHAYQTYKDGNSIYIDSNKSPLSVNYKDATRPDTTLEAVRNGGWEENGWGWYPVVGWYLYGAPGNWPPTNYGRTKPGEDMSESVKMYVYDPRRLQTSSMQRYNFIKDQMFGGIEYENGIQKKP